MISISELAKPGGIVKGVSIASDVLTFRHLSIPTMTCFTGSDDRVETVISSVTGLPADEN